MADVAKVLKELRETEAWLSGECDWRSYVVADAIALIESRLEPEWISVEDRLPEIPEGAPNYGMDVTVICRCDSGSVLPAVWSSNRYSRGGPRWETTSGRVARYKPTHWRPMPTFAEPKKEAADA